jgi:T5SS/PEP-CTERM-associated repeat protein
MPIASGISSSQAEQCRENRSFTRRRHVTLWLAAVSSISTSYVPSARANKTWIANTGSYTADANWAPNGVPTSSDTIEFGPLHPGGVTFPATTSFTVAGLVEKGGAYSQLYLNGSTLSVSGTISLGEDGYDQLNLVGGTVNSGSTTLGTSNTGTAGLAVFPNTVLNSSQQIVVGPSGVGSFIVEGQAFNSSGFIGQSSPSGTGNGNVFVDGVGASWNLTSNLMVGGMNTANPVLGFGTLTVYSGGSVSTPSLLVTGNANVMIDVIGV